MTSSILLSTEASSKATGFLLGLKVIIPDPKQASKIYKAGFYGKPFGIRKPGPKEYEEVLELSLVEAYYLVENGILNVMDENDNILTPEQLYNKALERIPEFEKLYIIYKDLREKGYIVRSGLKFGSDYSLYRQGPGIDHAPFLIHVYSEDQEIDPIEIVRAGRLSHSVRKKFILGVVGKNGVRYVSFKWFKP